MASMCKVTRKYLGLSKDHQVLWMLLLRRSYHKQNVASVVHLHRCIDQNKTLDVRLQQIRHMSDGRKGFFSKIIDNIKQEMTVNPEMKESLKQFREQREKLEQSDQLKQARKKFDQIEAESVQGSEKIKEGLKVAGKKVSETMEEVQKTEFVKKTMEIGEGIGEGLGKAGETIYKQGQNIAQSTPIKTVSSGVKAVKEEFDETAFAKARPFKPPEKLFLRSDKSFQPERDKIFEADDETVGVVLHKDAKWYQSWQNFRDNNQYVNKIFDLKMKYDESDNVLVRGSRFLTDKVSSLFGGMFSSTEMSEVLTEVCKMDPDFKLEKFVHWCHYAVIPNILEAIAQGDEEVLKDWCYEAPYNVLAHPIKQAKAAGLRLENKIMDVSNVDVAAGKIMEQGPVIVITFVTQQIIVARNPKGDIVEGDPFCWIIKQVKILAELQQVLNMPKFYWPQIFNGREKDTKAVVFTVEEITEKIKRIVYVWALCRDQQELNPSAAWKILDISAQEGQLWL